MTINLLQNTPLFDLWTVLTAIGTVAAAVAAACALFFSGLTGGRCEKSAN